LHSDIFLTSEMLNLNAVSQRYLVVYDACPVPSPRMVLKCERAYVFVVVQMACQDEDENDDGTEDAEEEAEHDCALVESAGELMPTLVELIGGPTFAPYFNQLLPELLKRLVCSVTSRLFAVSLTTGHTSATVHCCCCYLQCFLFT